MKIFHRRVLAFFVVCLFLSEASYAANVPGGVPAVIVSGASIASGRWPVLQDFAGDPTPLSETLFLAGYFDLGTVLAERSKGHLLFINMGRAGTTSYDLPDGLYDAVGDGSVPSWPGLKAQFERGFQQSLVYDGEALRPTATHLFISLPDDCYYAIDYADPNCVPRMISKTEQAIVAAQAQGLVVIVELQNDPEDLNLSGIPGLITDDQYNAMAQAWQAAFSGRQRQKVYTINLYRAANINPTWDLLDGMTHLTHGAMVRAADRLLDLIYLTLP